MSFTPRFGLRAKLMTGAAVLSAFTAVVGFGAIQDSNQNVDRSIQLFDGAVVPLNALGDVDGAFNESRAYTNDHILETDPAKRRALETKLAADDAKIDKLLQVAVDAPQSAADRAKLTELQDDMKQYRSLRAQVLALSNQGSDREAYALNKAKVLPVVNEAAEEFAVALAQKSRLAEQTFNESVAAARAGRTRTIVMLGFALVAGFGMAFVFSRRITQAVKQIVNRLQLLREHCATDLSNALQAVTEGDLTVTVTPVTPELERSSKDEIGDIAEAVNDIRNRTVESVLAYNTMVGQLSETMAELSEQASTVAAASQQMAATSEETGRAVSEIAAAVTEVAHGAERQVRGVEATREAVQAAASSAQTSSEVAAQTAQAADDARSVALEGVTAAASASAAMIEVAESSAAVGTAIHHLTERSERIGGIVGTITGLAEQTNLLALNAAIEAARAGEQGRGFAVVAEEVRKLAEESRGAAAEISSLIREMQDETSRVVGVVAEGTQRTQDGVATVERTREAFEAIGDAVEDMAARVGEISTAVDQISAEATRAENEVVEVAAVAEESSASAEQVSASTQQTSASAQEIAASAQTLSGTAEHLNSLVGRFKVA